MWHWRFVRWRSRFRYPAVFGACQRYFLVVAWPFFCSSLAIWMLLTPGPKEIAAGDPAAFFDLPAVDRRTEPIEKQSVDPNCWQE